MKKTLSLLMSSVLLISFSAEAKLSTRVDSASELNGNIQAMGSLDYMTVLPQIRSAAGDQGSGNITALNESYSKLKAQGIAHPTLKQVVDRLQQDRGLVNTADNSTLIYCALAGGMVLNTIGGIYFSRWLDKNGGSAPAKPQPQDTKDCKDKVSQVIQRSSSGSQTAEAKSKSAIQ